MTHGLDGIVQVAPIRLVADLIKHRRLWKSDIVIDGIVVGRRAPYNLLVSITRVPFCNEAGETRGGSKDDFHVPPLTSVYSCTE